MKILGIEITRVREAPTIDPQSAFAMLAAPPPKARLAVNRGILAEIIVPDIDESNPVERMLRDKFLYDLANHVTRGWFSICEVDDFTKSFGIPPTPDTARTYALLRKMHCVNFSIMPAELYRMLPHMINHVISGGQLVHPCLGLGVVDV